MKTNNSLKENHPEARKKLRLPDQLELVMEDGTVYRVRSFFAAEQQMGDVLWYNHCRFLIVSRTAFREVK